MELNVNQYNEINKQHVLINLIIYIKYILNKSLIIILKIYLLNIKNNNNNICL